MNKRESIEILTDANLYRRDKEVPSIYKVPNPKELGIAIDFAIKYMKDDVWHNETDI